MTQRASMPKHSKEWNQKISESLIGNKRGLGYRHTEEAKRKIGLAKTGEKHWNFVDGRSYSRESRHHTNQTIYKEWRMAVFERDEFTCQDCGKNNVYIEAHHIKGWTEYPSLRYDVDNGITLCKDCHLRRHKKC